MMKGFKISILWLGISVLVIPSSYGVSVSCMMAYDEGGISTVLESPECSEWVLSTESLQNKTLNCQSATLQGHRNYQEDRILCHLDMKIPRLGTLSFLPLESYPYLKTDFICIFGFINFRCNL